MTWAARRFKLLAALAAGVVAVAESAPADARPISTDSLVLAGSAQRLPDGTLRLASASRGHVVGVAWTPRRVFVRNGFTAEFTFRIQRGPSPPCDGFAFVVQNSARGERAMGADGGELGYGQDPGDGTPSLAGGPGIANSVAVEFDPCPNQASQFGRPDSVADPKAPHVSIHTRGRARNSADEQFSLGRTTAIPKITDGEAFSVRIVYRPGVLRIAVEPKVVLRVPLRLGRTLSLPDGRAWLGFTAANGDFTESDDILSFAVSRGKPI